jgi:lactate 2-monooxygenase
LGAKAVLLGRPYYYGLAENGEEGVCDVLNKLLADVDLTLDLAGCHSKVGLTANCVVEVPHSAHNFTCKK